MSPLVEKRSSQTLAGNRVEIQPRHKSLTFTLRKGVPNSTMGTDFNAEAVKYNLEETRKNMLELRAINFHGRD